MVKWCICDWKDPGSIPGSGNLQQPWQGQEQGRKAQPGFPFIFRFFLAVLCFNRSLFSSLCLLMSTVEPTEEGTTQPKRNKETTRSTTNCLQWAIGGGPGQYLCCTDTQGGDQNGKLYCILCAVWLSSKGAILKDQVLGKNKKQLDGFYARQPQVGVRFQLLENLGTPLLRLEACCSTADFSWGPLVLGCDFCCASGLHAILSMVLVHGTCCSGILRWPIVNAWPTRAKVWPENGHKKAPHFGEHAKQRGVTAELNNLQSGWGCPYLEVVRLTLRTRILHRRLAPQFECFHLPTEICRSKSALLRFTN